MKIIIEGTKILFDKKITFMCPGGQQRECGSQQITAYFVRN